MRISLSEQFIRCAPFIRGAFFVLLPTKGSEVYTHNVERQNFLTASGEQFYDLVTLERRWSVLTEDIRPSEVAEA